MWGAGPNIRLNECPAGYVTAESEALVAQHAASRMLKTPPLEGGLLDWPARLVDAFSLLEAEAYASAQSNDSHQRSA